MNENYLWDKTGNDSEIEKLENVLKTFRFTETAAPALPAKTFHFEPSRSRRFLRFSFAFAACLAFVVISLSVWFGVSKNNLTAEIKPSNISIPQPPAQVVNPPENSKSDIDVPAKINYPTARKSKKYDYLAERKSAQARNIISVKDSPSQMIARRAEPKDKEVKLTKEEKYAYDQLMLALSITSSKLKFVKDKADGLEKPDSVYSDGKYK